MVSNISYSSCLSSAQVLGAVLGWALCLGCASEAGTRDNTLSSGSDTGGMPATAAAEGAGGSSATLAGSADTTAGITVTPGTETEGVCGDGMLTEDEACDDGGTEDGDGCSADCLVVTPGYSCNPPGTPCHELTLCGDGIVASNELCDDGGTEDGDGCSASCKLELGFKCDGEPSTCSPTTCGDGVREGAESCDDGNLVPLDGCSATCQAEPDCSGTSCASDCGDRLVIDEECDDGNTLDGDGCSSACTLEPGFECVEQPMCETIDGACVLRVPAVFRDFTSEHEDFHCGTGTERPILAEALDALGKPVLVDGAPGCIVSADTFADWYTDQADNVTVPGSLVLFDNGAGGFVNRYGANGERWVDMNGEELDGNPLFFPVDEDPDVFTDGWLNAEVPTEYTGDQWRPESDFVPGAVEHNFLFTTEVGYWFRFDTGFSATLDFLGDDDMWVFVNGMLALDLGGLHVPEQGSVTIDDASAATFGLAPGGVYSIKVFHAERNPVGSSFKLTLSGFEQAPSECEPICGDGIVSLGEECDDGDNDGGYGECDPGCKLGPRCGDGIVQELEDCDDGNRIEGDACGNACRQLVVK